MYTCPVCSYPGLKRPPYEIWPPPRGIPLSPPYRLMLGMPSYEVCPQCGFEFGNDDDPGTAASVSFEDYRRRWEASGRAWFSQVQRDPRITDEPMYDCPVCTFPLWTRPYETWPPPDGVQLDPPYERVLGKPSNEACPQCRYEFGRSDNPEAGAPVSFEEYRQQWVTSGRAALSTFRLDSGPG